MAELLDTLRDRVVHMSTDDVRNQLATKEVESEGVAVIRGVGGRALRFAAWLLLSKEDIARRVGHKLDSEGIATTITVPTSYKGDSSDEHNWPAIVRLGTVAPQDGIDILWASHQESATS